MTIGALAAGICATSAAMHGLSVVLATRRCRRRPGPPLPPPENAPSVTIVQPLCGVETFSRETLRSIFVLDYPNYEIIFCLADGDDPIAPLVRGAIAANPDRPARLLVGDDRISANPKLNNVVKGWKAARYEWVIMANSNVLMPRDYIQRLLARWRPNTGIVCAPPIGSRTEFVRRRDRVRIPEHLPGALAVRGQILRLWLCPRQDDAVAPRHTGGRRKH